MTQAQKIKSQISQVYKQGAWVYIDAPDLISHLRDNRIDCDTRSIADHNGYDCAYDDSLTAFYYADGSILIVGSNGIHASE